jgi:signal transduction histidine kinase
MADHLHPIASTFFFADHLALDESPTRDFYKSMMQGLIHKNNNVLGVVQGFSSLVLMDDDVPEGIRENVEQMRNAAQNGTDLSRIILTAAGCARVSPDRANLGDLLPHLERSARSLAEKLGVPLEFHARATLPPILADTSKLNELFNELVKNAVESAATIPGGEVVIDVLPPGATGPSPDPRVDILIRNSSAELSEDKIRDAFVPFHGNKGNNHFGLGLTTAGILAGQMKMRLGLRHHEGTTTAWLRISVAS